MARISVKLAADRMGLSTSMVYLLCSDRRLPHFRLGNTGRRGKILIEEKDVDEFLMAARVEAGEGSPTPALRHINLK
ncbi:MAG: helix-turn-helix domain-containing protein [Planctomycetes bacterium]|nr:helix-turn-helix domain-containing protein [Planctomycetota bacterium]